MSFVHNWGEVEAGRMKQGWETYTHTLFMIELAHWLAGWRFPGLDGVSFVVCDAGDLTAWWHGGGVATRINSFKYLDFGVFKPCDFCNFDVRCSKSFASHILHVPSFTAPR